MKNIINDGHFVKIIAFSDTHNMHDEIQVEELPKADMLIHCGDFTMDSSKEQLSSFRQFIQDLSYSHKIVIAGNHDFIFNAESPKNTYSTQEAEEERQRLKEVCSFIQFQVINVSGVRILGISKGPEYFDWKFDFAKAEGQPIIETYRDKVDILVTHWPPFGILDRISHKHRGGSKGLLAFVKAVKPKMHIFGHIHQQRGHTTEFGIEFYNVSNATKDYDFNSEPFQIIFEKKQEAE